MDFHAFIIKAIGATNTKPRRIKITSCRYNQSVTISAWNESGGHYVWEIAKAHLQGLGYEFPAECTFEMAKFGHNGLVSTTFKPFKP